MQKLVWRWPLFVLSVSVGACCLSGCSGQAAPASTKDVAAFRGDPSKMPAAARAQMQAAQQQNAQQAQQAAQQAARQKAQTAPR